MTNPNILIPYEDYTKIKQDADDKAAALAILGAEFADETCRLIALKAVLGYVEPEEEGNEEPNTDPTEPEPDTTEPTDPTEPTTDPTSDPTTDPTNP